MVAEPNKPENSEKPEGGEQRGGRGGFRSRRSRPATETSDMQEGHEQELIEKSFQLIRSAKVVKGGRRFNSAPWSLSGQAGQGRCGLGKAGEVADAIPQRRGVGPNPMVGVSLKDATIPHEVFYHYCGAKCSCAPLLRYRHNRGKRLSVPFSNLQGLRTCSRSPSARKTRQCGSSHPQRAVSLRLARHFQGRGLEIKKVPPQCLLELQPIAESPAPVPPSS